MGQELELVHLANLVEDLFGLHAARQVSNNFNLELERFHPIKNRVVLINLLNGTILIILTPSVPNLCIYIS